MWHNYTTIQRSIQLCDSVKTLIITMFASVAQPMYCLTSDGCVTMVTGNVWAMY